MSYDYETEKPFVFTDEGQRMLLSIRDEAFRLISLAGAVRLDKLIATQTGNSWSMLACVDRLVELGDLIEIPRQKVASQYQVFTRKTVF